MIHDGFKDQLSKNLFWGEPADLISLKQKTGSRFDAIANETDPAKSVFNPYGPLFDDFGRRSSTQAGSLQISMLFLTQGAWNDKSPLAGQRGQFEHWLHVISQRWVDPIN